MHILYSKNGNLRLILCWNIKYSVNLTSSLSKRNLHLCTVHLCFESDTMSIAITYVHKFAFEREQCPNVWITSLVYGWVKRSNDDLGKSKNVHFCQSGEPLYSKWNIIARFCPCIKKWKITFTLSFKKIMKNGAI